MRCSSLLVLLLMIWCSAAAQTPEVDSTYVVSGRVTDALSKKPIRNVNVYLEGQSHRGVTTNQYGQYTLTLTERAKAKNQKLIFSHVSYEREERSLPARSGQHINLGMLPQSHSLAEFEISAGPEIVFGSQDFQLMDYAFMGDHILLMGYERKATRANIILVNDKEEIVARHRVPRKAISLFSDCQDDVYVITQDFMFMVSYEEEELILTYAEANRYNHLIQPCVDVSEPFYYFSRHGPGHLSVEYIAANVKEGRRYPIMRISDDPVLKAYVQEGLHIGDPQFDQRMQHALANVQKSEDNRSLRHIEDDRRFMKELHFKPVYAPLKVLDDELFVFDHLNGQIRRLALDGTALDSVPITYHSSRKWTRKLHFDHYDNKVYAHYENAGYIDLLPVDARTGVVKKSVRLDHRYLEKINIREGVVYYLYRPYGSMQRKYLYKQAL